MPTYRHRRSWLPSCCVLAAVWAVALWFPSAGQASCGDYVVIGNAAGTMEHPAQPADDLRGGAESRPAVPQPCSGPRCSRLPATPTPAPAPSTSLERNDDWGTLASVAVVAEQHPAFGVADVGRAVPVAMRTSVFHPPR